MSKPYPKRQAACEYALANIPTAKEIAELFGMSEHASNKVLTEARLFINKYEPERMKAHDERLQLARDEARRGQCDAAALAEKLGITKGQADLAIRRTVEHSHKIAAKYKAARDLAFAKRDAKEPKPRRTVRKFMNLSGTDATADRVRYPSGIGFGVVEVVR
jgi:hypothetical protein